MNKHKRKRLNNALCSLGLAEDAVYSVLDEEKDCINNMPENLQNTEMYFKIENAIDCLEEAVNSIYEAKINVKDAID